jgi:hypothetical protein
MLYLNPNKEKVLTFEVELSGVEISEITGYVRFMVEDIEVGFPTIISEGEIKAIIAPLKSFLKKPLKNGSVFEAQLQLFTEDEEYFSPWKGEIEVKMPVSVEAKIMDDGGGVRRSSVSVKAKPISERKELVPKVRIDKKETAKQKLKNLSEKDIIKYMERAGTKNETIQQIVLNEATASAAEKGYKGNVGILREVVRALKKPK